MKNIVKYILQKLLGFDRYLFVFAKYIIKKLPKDKNEKDFMHFLDLIKNKGSILDIGANLGIMTVHLSQRYPDSTVYAFEPMPQNLKTLYRIINHFKLKNIKVLENALGDKEGETTMVMPVVKSVKMQGLSHVVHESIDEFNEGIKIKVPLKKLDNIPLLKNKKISGIKIDVENFEYFALKGGEELIKSNKPIVYAELWDNENRKNCFNLFKNLNYNIYFLDNEKQELVNIMDQETNKQNFFFISN